MSGGLPELGSKISLISKADIRYEGRLYTVDPQECTIALSNVRSFGTEDRETQFQIAPQSQIYDYILFRGSDIKDIRVVNNGMPHQDHIHDPAIMQVQQGPHLMPHFPMPSMNAPTGAGTGAGGTTGGPQAGAGNAFVGGGPIGPAGGMAAAFGGMGGVVPNGGSGGVGAVGMGPNLAPGAPPTAPFLLGNVQGAGNQQMQQAPQTIQQQQAMQQQQKLQQQQQQQQPQMQQQQQQNKSISVLDMLAGASRSTTPISLTSRKSPLSDLMLNHSDGKKPQQQHNQQKSMNHQQRNSSGAPPHHVGNARDAGHKRQNHQQQQQQHRGRDYYNVPPMQQHRDRRDSGRNNADNYNDNNNRNNYNNNQQQRMQNRSGGWAVRFPQNNQNPMMKNRNMGGGVGPGVNNHRGGRMPMQFQGGYRPMSGGNPLGNQHKPRNTKNSLKFEQDFDFEQANNQFEELRSQFAKVKIAEDPKPDQINGEADKKDDSGNETGAGDHEHEEEEITVGYDKTKSFFDNISCEAAQDRSKNKKNDWRQERKLNSETFGVSSTRRGNHRGGGNYYYNNHKMGNYINVNGYNGMAYRNHRGNIGRNYNRNNLGRNNNNRPAGSGPRDNAPATAITNNNNNNGTTPTTATANTKNDATGNDMPKNKAPQQQPQTPTTSGTAAPAASAAGGSAASKVSTPQQQQEKTPKATTTTAAAGVAAAGTPNLAAIVAAGSQ